MSALTNQEFYSDTSNPAPSPSNSCGPMYHPLACQERPKTNENTSTCTVHVSILAINYCSTCIYSLLSNSSWGIAKTVMGNSHNAENRLNKFSRLTLTQKNYELIVYEA